MTWRPLIFIVLLGSVCSAARGPSDPLPSGFQIFPPNSVWNTRVDNLPVSSSNTKFPFKIAVSISKYSHRPRVQNN